MDIDPGSLSKYSAADILGHCLWEMTFLTIIQDIIPEEAINTESRSPNVDINIERNYA